MLKVNDKVSTPYGNGEIIDIQKKSQLATVQITEWNGVGYKVDKIALHFSKIIIITEKPLKIRE